MTLPSSSYPAPGVTKRRPTAATVPQFARFNDVLPLVRIVFLVTPTEAAMCQFRGRRSDLLQGVVIVTVLLLAVLVSVPVDGKNATAAGVVRLAVIAPADHEHEQSLYRVLPAVQLAVRKVADPVTGSLPGWDIRVEHRDSHCSSTFGPLAAFEFYINRSAGTKQHRSS